MELGTAAPTGNAPPKPPSFPPQLLPEVQTAVRIFIVTTLVLCVFITLGNLSILVAMRLDFRLREKAGLLISSLALVDLIVGVTMLIDHSIFLAKMHVSGGPPHGPLFTYRGFNLMLGEAGVFCSMFHVLLIGLDRLMTIIRPLRYQSIVTNDRTYAAVGLCSLLSLACGGGFWAAEQVRMMLVRPAMQTTIFTLCLVVLCICYGSMVLTAIKQRRKIAPAMPEAARTAPKGTTKRSRMLFTVIGLFVILWMPQIIFNGFFIRGMQPKDPYTFVVLSNVTKTLAMANSGVNIIVYCLLNRRFRETLLLMLRGRQPNAGESGN
ncbi:hypothetical protein CAPTEDRAFT_200051 [Capitella teleta]|uniref:G-protein coupled receptors family 1 profile domain-containing protein n=1 Tax=Capitella teleta TaxID=283909 RepID=R7UQR5_CAPTE|nr:hypothetical protein CAPTEDRAFT_200051 [Capitella teleta]|eukprot:ELU05756.1 hypothetical protein CAPTEDRAFT_200051 [Capitella teleta]